MTEHTFTVAGGFSVTEERQQVSAKQAADILCSRRRRRYTGALRSGSEITLIRHIWHCPFCEARLPAYARELECACGDLLADRAETAAWLQELSFLAEDNALSLQEPFSGEFAVCPTCGRRSRRSARMHELCLNERRGKVALSVRLQSIDDAMDTENVLRRHKSFRIEGFPLTETLNFDLRSGRVYLQLHAQDGRLLSCFDLSNDFSAWRDGVLYRLLRNHRTLRELKRAFLRQWKQPLPFCEKELDAERFWLMTRFVGYPRSFYDALPLRDCGFAFDRDLRKTAARLHSAADAVTLLCDPRLPQVKSVRRLCAKQPAFLFFLPELEKLHLAVKDINCYTQLLEEPYIFELLAQMHLYPRTDEFLTALTAAYGDGAVRRCAQRSYEVLFTGANRYCLLTPERQKQMLAQWDNGRYLAHREELSVPMHGTGTLRPYRVGNYSFIPLHSGSEYRTAGKALNNCLTSWRPDCNPVVIIRQLDRTVAAVEVEDAVIRQFRGFENMKISPQSQLGRAYELWRRHFGLTEQLITYA